MGLSALITSLVAVADSVTDGLQDTITYAAWLSDDEFNNPTYDANETIKCVVTLKQRMTINAKGESVVMAASILIPRPFDSTTATGRRNNIDNRDKITLSNGYVGPILNVTGVLNPDTGQPWATEVTLG